MSNVRRRFVGYDESLAVPNIVVDGSPNEATVLTLTHWPGVVQPSGTDVDTSAEMAFAYLDEPSEHDPAAVVTNNHYDQDGAVGLFALINPGAALEAAVLSQLIDIVTDPAPTATAIARVRRHLETAPPAWNPYPLS